MTVLLIITVLLIFFSFLAELIVVKPVYEIGTKLYSNKCGRINYTQIYEVVSFDGGEYLIKCIEGKDIFGKDIEFESKMTTFVVNELFISKDFIDGEYGLDILEAQKRYLTYITLTKN